MQGNLIVTSLTVSRCTQDCQRHDTTFSEIHGGNKIVKEFDNLFHLYLDGYKVWHHSRQSQSGPDEHQTLNNANNHPNKSRV